MSRMSSNSPEQARPEHPAVGREGGGRSRAARGRRLARTLAFQALYEMDLARHPPGEVLRRLAEERGVSAETQAYARELMAGVLRHREELDGIIGVKAPAWPLSQMSPIDRNILRLGLYECLYQGDTVPAKAAVNEAVELAKTFGSASSPRFVNGVLGRVIESLPSRAEPGVEADPKPVQARGGEANHGPER